MLGGLGFMQIMLAAGAVIGAGAVGAAVFFLIFPRITGAEEPTDYLEEIVDALGAINQRLDRLEKSLGNPSEPERLEPPSDDG